MNSRGPRIEPWGTPQLTGFEVCVCMCVHVCCTTSCAYVRGVCVWCMRFTCVIILLIIIDNECDDDAADDDEEEEEEVAGVAS